jgi:RNA polymerase sigma factor (sigma-70 family)
MATTLTDSALVARLRAGDDHAFDLLHDRYRRPLERFAARQLGPWHAEAAEDVVQDAFWRAHRALLADDRPVELRPWLYTIVRNRCLDVVRREPVLVHEVIDAPAADDQEPHARLVRRERLRAVVCDVLALPDRQRAALVGHVFRDEPHAVIARKLGVSENATKSLVNRARSSLRCAAAQRAA